MFHTFSIVDASFQLVAGELVGYSDYHRLLTAVRVGRRTRRSVGIRGRLRRGRRGRGVWRSMGRRRRVAGIGDGGDCLANSASDRRRAGRHLQLCAAIRAGDERIHSCRNRGKLTAGWTEISRRREEFWWGFEERVDLYLRIRREKSIRVGLCWRLYSFSSVENTNKSCFATFAVSGDDLDRYM